MTGLDDWPVLQGLFPAGWEDLARSSGAVRRRLRGFSTIQALLRTLLLHVGCGLSLRETAVEVGLAGIATVSDVALLNRLRDAETWLRQMCEALWRDNDVALEPSFAGRSVRLLDATVIREPGKTGSQWRLHFSLRLPTLECDHFELTPTRGADVAERFGRFDFQAGELVLADAGYCHAAGIAEVVAAKADVCVRLNPYGLSLFDEQGQPFPLLKRISRVRRAGQPASWPVQILSGKTWIQGRICAIRKSKQAIELAHKRLLRKKQQLKIKATAESHTYAEYVLLFTTLPEAEASAAKMLEVYRLRWQVELIFKRLKSIVQMGHVPKYDPQSCRAWLYGKLLVALLGQRLASIGKSISPWGYLLPQDAHKQPMA
ncbi:MAG TPA: IS4 family transposase [Acidobacteriaceae bacterium]|jgi:hypothetical protein